MNLDDVQDPIYEVLKTTTRPFRKIVPQKATEINPSAFPASVAESKRTSIRGSTEEDEPIYIACGVENMFAGIFEESDEFSR